MRAESARPVAGEETDLADTGTNDDTAAIADGATALIVTGTATALAVRRRRKTHRAT
ncbi:hypothetical protein ACIBRY_17390 [Streptomyces anulatus]